MTGPGRPPRRGPVPRPARPDGPGGGPALGRPGAAPGGPGAGPLPGAPRMPPGGPTARGPGRAPGPPPARPGAGRPGVDRAAARVPAGPPRVGGRVAAPSPVGPRRPGGPASPGPVSPGPAVPDGRPGRGPGAALRCVRPTQVVSVLAVLLLLLSGGVWFVGRQVDAGLSRADVLSTSVGSVLGGGENYLLVGLDTRTDSVGDLLPADVLSSLHAGSSSDGGDQTDTIMVVHVSGSGGQVTGFSIPRDSYVKLPGGFGTHKINSAYAYGQNASRQQLMAQGVSGKDLTLQSAAAGARSTVQTVASLTGLTITHFAAVNLAGFAAISTAIGGVPVCLNNAVDDSFSGAKFPAGPQTLSGPSALAFVRQRHDLPQGDLDRVRRQQVFLSAMAHAALSPSTVTDPTKVSSLLDAVDRAATVDQGLSVLGAASQLQAVASGSIAFKTIPIVTPNFQTPDDGDAVKVDPHAVQRFISDGGATDTTSAPPTTSAAPSGSSASGSSSSGSSGSSSSSGSGGSAAVPSTSATPASTVPCVN